jgi:hypothetical protein
MDDRLGDGRAAIGQPAGGSGSVFHRPFSPRACARARDGVAKLGHNLVLAGADALHFAGAIEASASEFITTDERLRKAKVAAAIPVLGAIGLRVINGAATNCLPTSYRQGELPGA